MLPDAQDFTLGIEEEYQIVNPATRELRPRAERVVRQARRDLGEEVQNELYLSQIETASPVCRTLAEVRAELVRSRRGVIAAAEKDGGRIAAAGTHPFSHWEQQQLTPKTRYRSLTLDFRQLTRELVIFGCHVHVGVTDPEGAVRVMNRARVWLAPLLALSANSPFWLGDDTGYASFRTELWGRFPMSGPPLMFQGREEYEALVRALTATETIRDTTKIYWDVRLPERIKTVEFRVADVCLTIDEAVMIAGLVRALVRTCYERALRDEPFCAARHELLRAAHWRAARYGLDAELIDVGAERAVPAREMIGTFLAFARSGLEAEGDWDEISSLVRETLQRGNGATRQRQVHGRAGRLEDVVDYVVEETAKGTGPV